MIFSPFQATGPRLQRHGAHCLALLLCGGNLVANAADILRSPDTDAALAYEFTAADEALLEEVQHGCFNYLWNAVGEPAGLARDRRTTKVASTAGVGFQLSALPVGVEHGWITRAEGEQRALSILRALLARSDNKHLGVYLHFVMPEDASQPPGDLVDQASTVDHALLLAGALPAATYFGGEVARLVDQMAADTNWRAYDVSERGLISFGWRPNDGRSMDGEGDFRPWDWHIACAEDQIVYFLAAGAPNEDYAVDAGDWYRLERVVKSHNDGPEFVVSWNSALFTYFFSHSWIDYRRFEADNPADFDLDGPRVDWVENSRRAVLTHRQRCIEQSERFKTLGPNRWGLSPCMGLNAEGRDSYLVQAVRPNQSNEDNFCSGTVAPYAAGSSIVFAPRECVAALHAMRNLRGDDGQLLAWQDPSKGGYGFVDSFNLDQQHASDDNIAIDVGPMILAIENARTGLVWKLFMQHHVARRAVEKLKWVERADAGGNVSHGEE